MTDSAPPRGEPLPPLLESADALAGHYARFRVRERVLLTGHSHQAWPDVAEEGLRRCFDDAARCVDDKWTRAFEQAHRVARGYAAWLGEADAVDGEARYAHGANTHELLFRLLSALDYRRRPRVVTTTGEFRSAARQLARLEEEGVEVVRVTATPSDDVGERLAAQVDDRTAAVIASAVFYESAELAGALDRAADACAHHGAALVIDAYHALGVLELPLRALGLEGAYVLGGGYKYLQLGEGACVLRLPPGAALRPVYTGWFAQFGALSEGPERPGVPYGPGAQALGGATYDPCSHYRAARVLEFFGEQALTPARLRAFYLQAAGRLRAGVESLDVPPDTLRLASDAPPDRLGGFLALRSPHAAALHAALKRAGVTTDVRGEVLRLGPAPYVSAAQLDTAIDALREAAGTLHTA